MGETQPDQTIEEIVQAVARGHALLLEDELLIGLARRQRGLGHETHRGTGAVENLGATAPGVDLLRQRLPDRTIWRQPGRRPVDALQLVGHQARAGLPWRLSRTETWEVPSWAISNSCVAASNLVRVA